MTRHVSLRVLGIVMVSGLVLAACGGFDVLLQLGATVDLYFSEGDFGFHPMDAASFVGKVLGSGAP